MTDYHSGGFDFMYTGIVLICKIRYTFEYNNNWRDI